MQRKGPFPFPKHLSHNKIIQTQTYRNPDMPSNFAAVAMTCLLGKTNAALRGSASPSYAVTAEPKQQLGLFGGCTAHPTANGDESVNFGVDYRCDHQRYALPSAWASTIPSSVHASKGPQADYDLAIIGGGIAAGYLVDQLREKMGDAAKDLKIGIFEATHQANGRLMSAWGPGNLGNAVPSAKETAPMECGGMRVDPNAHYLVWDAVQKVARRQGLKCQRSGLQKTPTFSNPILKELMGESIVDIGTTADCDDYVQKEATSDLRYFTSGSNASFGAYLQNSSLYDDGSIETECLSLGVMAARYNAKYNKNPAATLTTEATDDACKPANCIKMKEEFPNMCEVCAKFPHPGLNLVSCIGYDDLPSVASNVGFDEAQAVVGRGAYNCDPKLGSVESCSHLYLFRHGTERFAQDLLYMQGDAPSVGPVFNKRLVAVEYGDDADATVDLAAKQAALTKDSNVNCDYTKPDGACQVSLKSSSLVTLRFEDGSVVRAKAAYLTMLPADLVQVKGLEAWRSYYEQAFLPFGATKMFMAWEDGMPDAIRRSTRDGATRLVLDGDRPGWLARQVFYWDENTILLYQTAPQNPDLPANQMQHMIQSQGMGATMKKVVDELSLAHNATLPMPTWARAKGWTDGSLSYYQANCGSVGCSDTALGPLTFSSRLERPLGSAVPVFYGSSEMNGNGGNGWMQGSLEEIALQLPTIVAKLSK